jgi:hypothetical protein
MLSAVLKSDITANMSVKIIRSFVNMRKLISNNALITQYPKITLKKFDVSHIRFLIKGGRKALAVLYSTCKYYSLK